MMSDSSRIFAGADMEALLIEDASNLEIMVVKSHIVAAVLICGSYALRNPAQTATLPTGNLRQMEKRTGGRPPEKLLPLAGLFWLNQETTPSALIPKNAVVFPPKAQPTPALSS